MRVDFRAARAGTSTQRFHGILHRVRTLALLALFVALVSCSAGANHDATPGAGASGPPHGPSTTLPTVAPTPNPKRVHTAPPDPRWVFFTDDEQRYASAWFTGRHRIMIGFGCTEAPYYSPDPSCSHGNGFHHGIDMAMPCGTPLRAGRPATVLDNGALGSAYGENPVLLRVDGLDVVIGHTRKVFVEVGERIEKGERFALASDSGAPDGCHLHFEVRSAGTSVSGAAEPRQLLGLR